VGIANGPAKASPIPWPEMLRMDKATKAKVDAMWEKLGPRKSRSIGCYESKHDPLSCRDNAKCNYVPLVVRHEFAII